MDQSWCIDAGAAAVDQRSKRIWYSCSLSCLLRRVVPVSALGDLMTKQVQQLAASTAHSPSCGRSGAGPCSMQ
jgi:hypothetical protein